VALLSLSLLHLSRGVLLCILLFCTTFVFSYSTYTSLRTLLPIRSVTCGDNMVHERAAGMLGVQGGFKPGCRYSQQTVAGQTRLSVLYSCGTWCVVVCRVMWWRLRAGINIFAAANPEKKERKRKEERKAESLLMRLKAPPAPSPTLIACRASAGGFVSIWRHGWALRVVCVASPYSNLPVQHLVYLLYGFRP
jgi:hypothetical protein